jgi:hypothetical protein
VIFRRLFLFSTLSLAISGCVTNEVITGPDGTANQLITCNQVEDCYQNATQVCGGKYTIVNTSSESGGLPGQTATIVKLLVKCGAAGSSPTTPK